MPSRSPPRGTSWKSTYATFGAELSSASSPRLAERAVRSDDATLRAQPTATTVPVEDGAMRRPT